MSRTSWRGSFCYRGDRSELIQNSSSGFSYNYYHGIYGPWMAINLRKYLLGNVRFGDAEFDYDGDGGDYFVMNIKGYF
jgi:hypothetical protein